MTAGRARCGSRARLAAVLAILVAVNLLNNWLLPEAYLPTCVASAFLLLLIGRCDGCSWTDLGLAPATAGRGLRWALAAAGLVLLVFLTAAALPVTHPAFLDERAGDLTLAAMLWHALVRIPFGTVLLEEVAFRGVLYAVLAARAGTSRAVLVSSLLFGIWHVLPALGLLHDNAAVESIVGSGDAGRTLSVLAAVAGTAAAGLLLCELRRRSGSLLAPAGLHLALNGLGLAFAWAVTRSTG
jgi:membrane protease YdiL (CAAX protease family)